jgi:hypothetical protein
VGVHVLHTIVLFKLTHVLPLLGVIVIMIAAACSI